MKFSHELANTHTHTLSMEIFLSNICLFVWTYYCLSFEQVGFETVVCPCVKLHADLPKVHYHIAIFFLDVFSVSTVGSTKYHVLLNNK